MKKYYLIIILLFLVFNIYAQDNNRQNYSFKDKIKPDYIRVQFAGNIGFMSGGIGYKYLNGKVASDLLIGYVPKFIDDNEIISVILKNTFQGKNFKADRLKYFYPTSGFSINVETGKNSFLKTPTKYPDGYYSTNAITCSLFYGLAYQGKVYPNSVIKQFEYYAEIGTLATYLYYDIRNKDYFNFDIFSLALGVKIKI